MLRAIDSNSFAREAVVLPRAAASELKAFVRVLDFATHRKFEFISATHRIDEVVSESGIIHGVVHVQSLHTTTGLFINEWQEALLHDFKILLEKLVGTDAAWHHDDPACSDCQRRNAASHLQSLVLGQSVSLQVRNTKVLLGTWQNIILAELDGPRTRSVSIQVMGV